jgi:hypothetical protein
MVILYLDFVIIVVQMLCVWIEDSNLIMLNIYEFLLAACYYGPDLKLNVLEIVEQYRRRQSLLEVMAQNKCHRCPKLQEHYTLMRNQQQLKERVKQLKYELSDAALQQMPDFQQRVPLLSCTNFN